MSRSASPLLQFMLGGVQKSGTTALARYLAAHPGIALPRDKEAHVFDAPDFDESWRPETIDERLRPLFDGTSLTPCCGDATPITCFHPRLIERTRRYNPRLRWVVLLRDPVERALSHYFMERARGAERWPLLTAMLAERWRLRGHEDDFSGDSPLRKWSYAARGRYVRQLDALYAAFPSEQILLLRSLDLHARPAETATRVLSFLGLPALPDSTVFARHFEGGYRQPGPYSPARVYLRWCLRGEATALRQRYGIDLRAAPL